MREVQNTLLAGRDTREIMDYLLERSEAAADRFNAELESVRRVLAGQPRIGRARDDLLPGLRSVVVGKYLVFFRATDDVVMIVRIIHGARDITLRCSAGRDRPRSAGNVAVPPPLIRV